MVLAARTFMTAGSRDDDVSRVSTMQAVIDVLAWKRLEAQSKLEFVATWAVWAPLHAGASLVRFLRSTGPGPIRPNEARVSARPVASLPAEAASTESPVPSDASGR